MVKWSPSTIAAHSRPDGQTINQNIRDIRISAARNKSVVVPAAKTTGPAGRMAAGPGPPVARAFDYFTAEVQNGHRVARMGIAEQQ